MTTYTRHIVNGQTIKFSSVGAHAIPKDEANSDYATMMQEVADGLAEIVEVDDTPVPTVDELRIAAYGPIGDQLDEIYHDIDAWKSRIAAVKAANPK